MAATQSLWPHASPTPEGKLTLAHVHPGVLRAVHAASSCLAATEREDAHKLLERERAAANVTAELVSRVSMTPGHCWGPGTFVMVRLNIRVPPSIDHASSAPASA